MEGQQTQQDPHVLPRTVSPQDLEGPVALMVLAPMFDLCVYVHTCVSAWVCIPCSHGERRKGTGEPQGQPVYPSRRHLHAEREGHGLGSGARVLASVPEGAAELLGGEGPP